MKNFWLDKIEEEKLEWAKDVEWKKAPQEEWVMFVENAGHLYNISWKCLDKDENIFVVKFVDGGSKAKTKFHQWIQCTFEGAKESRKVLLTRYKGIRAAEQFQMEDAQVVAINWSDLSHDKSYPVEIEVTLTANKFVIS